MNCTTVAVRPEMLQFCWAVSGPTSSRSIGNKDDKRMGKLEFGEKKWMKPRPGGHVEKGLFLWISKKERPKKNKRTKA